jgi:KaiC/GvpD/RAD55 family RecA-like ATPase
MKSSLVFNIMYNEALHGKTSLYISLEQSSTSLINHMINLEYNMDKDKPCNTLRHRQAQPDTLKARDTQGKEQS